MKAGNSLRARNLDFFKSVSPQAHRRLTAHKPISEIVLDATGEPDIVTAGQSRYGGGATRYAAAQLEAFWKNPYRFLLVEPKPYPVKGQFFDAYTNRFLKKALGRAREADIEFFDHPRTPESYFLIIFGIGLGHHIDELVAKTDCLNLLLVEPNFDTFYHSMEFYDWSGLADRIYGKGGSISFVFDDTPEKLAGSIIATLRNTNPCSVDGSIYFVHDDTPFVSNAVAIIKREIFAAFATVGQFYDESLMLRNTHATLGSGKEKVYSTAKARTLDVPAFIIGSGPSLDAALPFIRDNAEKAVIISSGSAIRPLIRNGIEPDFQVELENVDVLPVISQVAEAHDVSGTCLVAATSVDLSILKYFDRAVYYFRPMLTPFPLFCDSDDFCLKDPDPTVVNASLSFAQGVGFRDLYFFGVDMGTKDPDAHHSKDTYHFTPGALPDGHVYDIPLPGNFGGTCFISPGLFVARNHLIKAINDNTERFRYFNCSDGAIIDGAEPLKHQTLSLPEIAGGKAAVIEGLIDDFPVFTEDRFNEGWNEKRLTKAVNAFVEKVIGQIEGAAPFRDRRYLTPMMDLLNPHIDQPALLADRPRGVALLLFRGTLLMMLMVFEYYLRRVATEKKTDAFAKIGIEEMTAAVEHLRDLAVGLIADPSAGGPPESDRSGMLIHEVPKTEPLTTRIPRNAPCPCGSGRRYKNCHGKAG